MNGDSPDTEDRHRIGLDVSFAQAAIVHWNAVGCSNCSNTSVNRSWTAAHSAQLASIFCSYLDLAVWSSGRVDAVTLAVAPSVKLVFGRLSRVLLVVVVDWLLNVTCSILGRQRLVENVLTLTEKPRSCLAGILVLHKIRTSHTTLTITKNVVLCLIVRRGFQVVIKA